MNIREMSFDTEIDNDSVMKLRKILDNSGSCIMNGFLGDDLTRCSFNDVGNLEFSSHHEEDETIIDSSGVVLSDSVLLKQTEKSKVGTYYNLYSWDIDENVYTFLSFGNMNDMNRFYDTIMRFDVNLCKGDISKHFQSMGLTFDNIHRILINQSVDPFSRMFDDELDKIDKEDSFTY